jgi:hypothetical protein
MGEELKRYEKRKQPFSVGKSRWGKLKIISWIEITKEDKKSRIERKRGRKSFRVAEQVETSY